MHPLLRKLAGTDRRSIGKSSQVVVQVLKNPRLFRVLFDGMLDADPILRMRCADAVEKITARRPELLHPYKKRLIHHVARIEQQEVRWHVAQMVSRLELTPRERRAVVAILREYLNDQSGIVRTFSMRALADIAKQDATLRPAMVRQLENLTRTGTPAMQARGRKLLAKLKPSHQRK
jgi:hypothetical protein